MLTRKDFQTRYKRTSLGVLWAVAVPALQASIMAFVFSKVIKTGTGPNFAIYVIGGVIAYSYVSVALSTAGTAIVDGAALADKVWFPRAVLVVVPCLSGLVGLGVTLLVLVAVMPLFDVHFTLRLTLLIPGTLLLVAFTVALSLVLAALHVYFRDVRYLIQAALMVWLYVTPILYPARLLGRISIIVNANPLTGIVALFHEATVGGVGPLIPAVAVSVGSTIVLAVLAAEIQRRHDRLFVDLL